MVRPILARQGMAVEACLGEVRSGVSLERHGTAGSGLAVEACSGPAGQDQVGGLGKVGPG